MKIKNLDIDELTNRFDEILKLVEESGKTFLITRNGEVLCMLKPFHITKGRAHHGANPESKKNRPRTTDCSTRNRTKRKTKGA